MNKPENEEELISKILEETLSLSASIGAPAFLLNEGKDVVDSAKELNKDHLEFVLLKCGIKYLSMEYQKENKLFRMALTENKNLDFPENWYCFEKIKKEREQLRNSFQYLSIDMQNDSEKLITLFSKIYQQDFLELFLIYNEKNIWLCLCTNPSVELRKEISKIKNIKAA